MAKISRNHTIVVAIVVIAALIALAIILAPSEKVTGSLTDSGAGLTLTVESADSATTGDSIQGIELVPAPTSTNLQSPAPGTDVQQPGTLPATE